MAVTIHGNIPCPFCTMASLRRIVNAAVWECPACMNFFTDTGIEEWLVNKKVPQLIQGRMCKACGQVKPVAAFKDRHYCGVCALKATASNWGDYAPRQECLLCGDHFHDTNFHLSAREEYVRMVGGLEIDSVYLPGGGPIFIPDYSWVDKGIEMTRWKRNYGGNYGNTYGTVSAQWVPQVNAYKLHFPYIFENNTTKNFIELIKAKVPSNERNYDPADNHAWYISEQFFDALLPIMQAMFTNCAFNIVDKKKVEEYNQGTAMSIVISTDKLAEEFFKLLESAGLQPNRDALEEKQVKKDYLRAAMYYHPDRKPEFEPQMYRLNELWMNLKGVYFK